MVSPCCFPAQIEEKRMKFEYDMEVKRMEEGRKSEQEHESRVLQMLVVLSRPSSGSIVAANHSQVPMEGEGSASDASDDVRYNMKSSFTFNWLSALSFSSEKNISLLLFVMTSLSPLLLLELKISCLHIRQPSVSISRLIRVNRILFQRDRNS